jgi:pimeloyl-ACP methyl ester carboxylesterase
MRPTPAIHLTRARRRRTLLPMTESHYADLGRVRLHYLSEGRTGPPLVFVHGFPEFSGAWAAQLQEFRRDHRALAPDLRGYNLSSRPEGVANYAMPLLVEDLRRFIAQVAGEPCAVVAHDWGGVCAWHLAAAHPEWVKRLVIINSPHPATLYRDLRASAAQREAMRYTLLFRTPRAEQLLGENDFARLAVLFESWEIGGVPLAPAFVAAYRQAWSRPGALTTMLNYYRASDLHPPGPGDPGVDTMVAPPDAWRVNVPTRVIWGERDGALLPGLLDGLDEFVPGVDICRIAAGTHWVAHEFPDQVNALIRAFVAQSSNASPT